LPVPSVVASHPAVSAPMGWHGVTFPEQKMKGPLWHGGSAPSGASFVSSVLQPTTTAEEGVTADVEANARTTAMKASKPPTTKEAADGRGGRKVDIRGHHVTVLPAHVDALFDRLSDPRSGRHTAIAVLVKKGG
jgi:hypothetical protein